MDRREGKRLDALLPEGSGRRFTRSDIRLIERALGRAAPAVVRRLWSRFGAGTISGGSTVVDLADASLVLDLLEQYEEAGLHDLLPLAAGDGARHYAVDLQGKPGLPPARSISSTTAR